MKRHVTKAETKARIARRNERFERGANMRRERKRGHKGGWGRPHRTDKQLQYERWICGRLLACRIHSRDGSKLALRERRVLARGGPGVWYIDRWDEMDRRRPTP